MKRTALITGASSGFGAAFARLFAQDGYNVVLVARSLSKLQVLADELSQKFDIQAIAVAKDLSLMEEVEALYEELNSQGIGIDFLVNNAGFGDYAYFHQADWKKQEQMIDLNVKSLTKLSYLFVRPMVANGFGRILNVASTAAFQPGPTMAVYYATKAFVLSLGEAMSNELDRTGVTVTTLCPGASETGFQQAADLGESKLVKGRKLPSAMDVAIFGYKHMHKGSLTVIPGFQNWLGAFATRLMPRKLTLKIVRNVQERA